MTCMSCQCQARSRNKIRVYFVCYVSFAISWSRTTQWRDGERREAGAQCAVFLDGAPCDHAAVLAPRAAPSPLAPRTLAPRTIGWCARCSKQARAYLLLCFFRLFLSRPSRGRRATPAAAASPPPPPAPAPLDPPLSAPDGEGGSAAAGRARERRKTWGGGGGGGGGCPSGADSDRAGAAHSGRCGTWRPSARAPPPPPPRPPMPPPPPAVAFVPGGVGAGVVAAGVLWRSFSALAMPRATRSRMPVMEAALRLRRHFRSSLSFLRLERRTRRGREGVASSSSPAAPCSRCCSACCDRRPSHPSKGAPLWSPPPPPKRRRSSSAATHSAHTHSGALNRLWPPSSSLLGAGFILPSTQRGGTGARQGLFALDWSLYTIDTDFTPGD